MQVVILAGGLATRLGEQARTQPKSLLEFAGKPFIHWQLERLTTCGFRDVVLCVGHLASAIQGCVRDGAAFGMQVQYAGDGPKLLGTGGAIQNALPLLAERFLVTYGDSYLPFDYATPLTDLLSHPGALGTLAVLRNHGRWDRSNCEVRRQKVLRYAKGSDDPALDAIDYGAMALCRSAIDPRTLTPWGLEQLQSNLAERGCLRALEVNTRFYEVGSLEGQRDFQQFLAARGASGDTGAL